MDKKVALFVAVGIKSINILGGITYSARKLWYGKSKESEVLKQVCLKNETKMKTISKYEVLEQKLKRLKNLLILLN